MKITMRQFARPAAPQDRAGVPRPAIAVERFFADLPRFTIDDPDCGVISAADEKYFPGFQFLARSLLGKVHVALYDLGLGRESTAWCARHGIAVLQPRRLAINGPHFWQSWNKPFYLEQSP